MDRGFENLLWFMGVVEDNNDPQMLGRVRVRAFGIHPTDLTKVPTEDLPWAYVVSGTYQANYKPPELNSWAFGFFIDGKAAQQPILLGVLLGMPTNTPAAYGDSNGGYSAMGDGLSMNNLFRPDISRLATGEETHNTSVMVKHATGGQPVRTGRGENWSTPTSSYNAQYPKNYVHETPSGHVFELDDTPGNERVNLYHRSGSYIEINPDGAVILKSTGSGFIMMENNGYVRIKGNANITVEGEADILVQNNCDLSVDGTMTQKVYGDYVLNVSGRYDVNVGEAIRMRGAKVGIESATDNVDIISKNNMNIQSGADINMKAAANMKIGTGGILYLNDADTPPADASATDMEQPEQRKEVAKIAYADPKGYGLAGEDTGFEPYEGPEQPSNDEYTNSPISEETRRDIENNQDFLNMVGDAEGTDKGRGYNEVLGYGKFGGGDANITDMTLNEVYALGREILHHPANNFNSSAIGRYQFVGTTMMSLAKQMGLDPATTKFTPQIQDAMALYNARATRGRIAELRKQWVGLRKVPDSVIRYNYSKGM